MKVPIWSFVFDVI